MPNYIDPEDLTRKQRLFCQFYIKNGFNGTKAAKDAGYSENSAKAIANENLTKPYVKSYIEQTMKEKLDSLGAGVDYRAASLKACVQAGLEGRADKDGCVNIEGVVKTIDLLNKMDGSYAPEKKEINTNLEVSKLNELVNDYDKEF